MTIPAELVVSGMTSAPNAHAETAAPAGATSNTDPASDASKAPAAAAPAGKMLTQEEWDAREKKYQADLEKARQFGRKTQAELEEYRKKADPVLERERKEREARLAMPEQYQKIYDEHGPIAAQQAMVRDALESERERQAYERTIVRQAESDKQAMSMMQAEWEKSGKSIDEFQSFVAEWNGFANMTYEKAMWIVQHHVAGENAHRVTTEAQEKMAREAEETARRKVAESQPRGKTATSAPGDKATPGPLDGMKTAAARMDSVSSWD